jgi:hypothetical protein
LDSKPSYVQYTCMPFMYEEKVLIDMKWEMNVWTDIRKSKINYSSINSNSNEKKKVVHCEKTSIKVNIYLAKVEIDTYLYFEIRMWMELNFCVSFGVSGSCCVLTEGWLQCRWSFLFVFTFLNLIFRICSIITLVFSQFC